eukprot:2569018-Karenia_brevis.AAC.1
MASVNGSAKPVARTVLNRPDLNFSVRSVHAQPYLYGRGLYNAGVWSELSMSEQRTHYAGV